ncbi:hypothetical protein [Sphingomonas endophytica]|uniref:Uncharacterized protein n=1 Tax=Sphingomonas endophytica TaxID=869719 RepID=A0A147I1M3_9SPHN|nr:hypothetical protein [Sphingomonas endophytica]KTT71473.1 hypothetical protein NS334_10330 [Sphingomonas endophytica]
MKDLASRQADRVIRKAENALACGVLFDASRGGIGVAKKPGRASNLDADGINAATAVIIARVVEALGAAPLPVDQEGFRLPLAPKVKLSGI